jgi:exopolysaccharide production protein ExoZ
MRDHIRPRPKDGALDGHNKALACDPCNQQKARGCWPARGDVKLQPMREVQDQGRLPGIQLGRAVAAIAVFYFHSHIALGFFDAWRMHTWPWLAAHGAVGVDLFFAISGFIVCYITARPGFRPFRFLAKRFFRIYPLNALVTLVVILLFWYGIGGRPTEIEFRRVLRSLLIVPQTTPMNSVGWTLENEIAFYLVAAALIPLGGPRLLLTWCLGATAIGAWFEPQMPLIARFANGHYANFAAGVLAYIITVRPGTWSTPAQWACSALLLPLALGVYLWGLWLPFAWLTPVAGCIAVTGLVLLPWAPQWTVRLGDISYGIYLWHWPLVLYSSTLALLVRAGTGSGEYWRWGLLLLLLGVAWLSWTFFEQPINRWAARRLGGLANRFKSIGPAPIEAGLAVRTALRQRGGADEPAREESRDGCRAPGV